MDKQYKQWTVHSFINFSGCSLNLSMYDLQKIIVVFFVRPSVSRVCYGKDHIVDDTGVEQA